MIQFGLAACRVLLMVHRNAVLQALFVTFLWSTSWVLIKIGLQDIPPLMFAGLRYFLAFLILIPVYFLTPGATSVKALTTRDWRTLAFLGFLYYAVAQGTQFLGLLYLPAITFSLLLNSIALVVAALGILFLGERPTWLQWAGAAVFVGGALLFFYPLVIPRAEVIGYVVAAAHILAAALAAVLGRGINRSRHVHPITVTLISMGIGSALLLAAGLIAEPWPRLSTGAVVIIVWLAAVNTAFAFALWNHTLRTLSAMESSIINNTMMIQIAVLAWVFLGERLTPLKIVALLVAGLGAMLVQLRRQQVAEPVV